MMTSKVRWLIVWVGISLATACMERQPELAAGVEAFATLSADGSFSYEVRNSSSNEVCVAPVLVVPRASVEDSSVSYVWLEDERGRGQFVGPMLPVFEHEQPSPDGMTVASLRAGESKSWRVLAHAPQGLPSLDSVRWEIDVLALRCGDLERRDGQRFNRHDSPAHSEWSWTGGAVGPQTVRLEVSSR